MMIRLLFVVLLTLMSSRGFAAGWNDFTLDIGHGFEISKFNSLEVCLSLKAGGDLLICPARKAPSHGPIDDYAFTENHLLIRTNGAMLADDGSGRYVPDPDREHFFIVDRQIENPYSYQPLGPLDAEQFYAMAAVPADFEWQNPGNPNAFAAAIGVFLFLCIALLIYGWPVLLAGLAVLLWLIARRLIRGRKDQPPKPA